MLALYVTAVAFEESVQRASEWAPNDVETFVTELRNYFQALPADRFPLTVALAGPLTAGADADDRFEFGIQIIVSGLAATVPAEENPAKD